MAEQAFAVRSYSHWQGATNPGEVICVVASRADAEKIADALSTCSFCSPGRTSNYSVGSCYCVRPTKRYQPGYGLENVDEAVLQDCGIDY